MSYILGQFFGLVATVACIIVPLYKKKWQMLLNTALVNLMMILNLVFIGEVGSAVCLCAVAIVQCFFSLAHDRRNTDPGRVETVLFFLLYIGFGFFGLVTAPGFVWAVNARNLLELMPIAGSLLSMTFVFIREEQRARWFLLATCSVWAVYTALIGSTTFFAQLFTVITTAAAIYRYRRQPTAEPDC